MKPTSTLLLPVIFLFSFIACQGQPGETDEVARLIQKLNSAHPKERWLAAKSLGETKDSRSVEPLIITLKDDNSVVRYIAAEALGKINDPRATIPLITSLNDEDHVVRIRAAEALSEIKDPRATKPLIESLKDNDYNVRVRAAGALREIKDPDSVDPLLDSLTDEDHNVRKNAARALGKTKDPRAVQPLISVLQDTQAAVRKWAAWALGEIDDVKAIDALIVNLTDWYSHPEVTEALARLGWQPQSDKDIIYFLVGQRNEKELAKRWELMKRVLIKDTESHNYRTIENAVYAFIGMGKEEILPVLAEKLTTDGKKAMAEVYLNCDHPELQEAAEEWAEKNGYIISKSTETPVITWGAW